MDKGEICIELIISSKDLTIHGYLAHKKTLQDLERAFRDAPRPEVVAHQMKQLRDRKDLTNTGCTTYKRRINDRTEACLGLRIYPAKCLWQCAMSGCCCPWPDRVYSGCIRICSAYAGCVRICSSRVGVPHRPETCKVPSAMRHERRLLPIARSSVQAIRTLSSRTPQRASRQPPRPSQVRWGIPGGVPSREGSK